MLAGKTISGLESHVMYLLMDLGHSSGLTGRQLVQLSWGICGLDRGKPLTTLTTTWSLFFSLSFFNTCLKQTRLLQCPLKTAIKTPPIVDKSRRNAALKPETRTRQTGPRNAAATVLSHGPSTPAAPPHRHCGAKGQGSPLTDAPAWPLVLQNSLLGTDKSATVPHKPPLKPPVRPP